MLFNSLSSSEIETMKTRKKTFEYKFRKNIFQKSHAAYSNLGAKYVFYTVKGLLLEIGYTMNSSA